MITVTVINLFQNLDFIHFIGHQVKQVLRGPMDPDDVTPEDNVSKWVNEGKGNLQRCTAFKNDYSCYRPKDVQTCSTCKTDRGRLIIWKI